MRRLALLALLALAGTLAASGCGRSNSTANSTADVTSDATSASSSADASGLTAAQLEHGIGPITTVDVGETVEAALATRGLEIFNQKCSACHKMDERYVGPPLRDVTTRRSPAFVMNQLLNPAEMAQKHPEGKKLLAEYLTQMPDQQLTQDDARAILEYLRQQATEAPVAAPAS